MASELVTNTPPNDKAEAGKESRRRARWTLLLLILLAFALRLYDLGGNEFWFDEALTANISELGWTSTITYLRSVPFEHPPLYYLSIHPWQLLVGTSEFTFRLYSAFWGVLFVPLLYALVRRLGGEHLALLAALLATISPFMVAYSQEARMYTLLPCLALLALWSFYNALEREERPAWWLAYLLLLAIGVATHYYFALIWMANTFYLLIESLRRRKARWGAIAAQGLALAVAAAWLFLAPGLRSSLVRIWQGETAFSLGYKLGKVIPTLLLAEIDGGSVPVVVYVLAAAGWALALLGIWWSRRGQLLQPRAWLLLLLLLIVPLAGSLLIPYGVLGRHLGYLLIPLLIFGALGLIALAHRGRIWLALGIVAVLLISSYGLMAHYTASNGDFGQAMAYIDERGQPGDILVLTQPDQHPLVAYYNDREWPVRYVPPTVDPVPAAELARTLADISQEHDRLWLGPVGAWTADPERIVEQWLTANAFQAEKAWFPGSSLVALYFTGDQDLAPVEIGNLLWGGSIQLQGLFASPLYVPAGDALKLRLDWRAGFDLGERYEVGLLLVDDQGLPWAERRSEPCGGWCPTDTWQAGNLTTDRHALLIPPGTPPGIYRLQLTWTPLGGGPALYAEEDGQRVDQITLAQVTVLRPQGDAGQPWALPNAQQITFGGEITLLGYQPAAFDVRAGEILHMEAHWQAELAPSADYTLLLEMVDRWDQVVADWRSMPFVGAYPTSAWQPGEYLRGQHHLRLPSNLAPGRYQLRAALLSPQGERLAIAGDPTRPARKQERSLVLASIRILDRPRLWDMPPVSHPLAATVGRQAYLVGYDLDASQAHPGGQLRLTLYWQAGGPMVRPFKVFTHLVDGQNNILAQHDAPPGGGCCPANTWIEGEVIVDEHVISLGADLPPGTWQLMAGMYDEATDSRVPTYDAGGNQLAGDRVQISEVVIVPAQVDGQGGDSAPRPLFELEYLLYFPLQIQDLSR